jgi:hypothetical protein
MSWKTIALVLNIAMIPVLVFGTDYRSTFATRRWIDGLIAVGVPWGAVIFTLIFLFGVSKLNFIDRAFFLGLMRVMCVVALIFNGLVFIGLGFLFIDGLGQKDISSGGLWAFILYMLVLTSVPVISWKVLLQEWP